MKHLKISYLTFLLLVSLLLWLKSGEAKQGRWGKEEEVVSRIHQLSPPYPRVSKAFSAASFMG